MSYLLVSCLFFFYPMRLIKDLSHNFISNLTFILDIVFKYSIDKLIFLM